VASGLDVAQEETLLNQTRTQLTLLRQQRKQFEDAIAVLVGRPAPDFHVGVRELNAEPPTLDAGLPSDLLERRPDIAEAERQMAVANAQIGVAQAAYYPSLNLFGQGGWQTADIAKLAELRDKLREATEAGADCSGVSCGRSRDAESEPGRTAERAEGMPAAQRRAVMTVLVVFMMTMVVDANECTDMRDAGWSLKMCGDGRRRCDGFKH